MEATVLYNGSSQFVSWLGGMLLVWALGLVFGWMLPRPKWIQRWLRSKAIFIVLPPGLWVRRATLALHGALIVRHLWRYFHSPGTFRALLKAVWVSVRYWQPIEWPRHHDGKVMAVAEPLVQQVELSSSDALPEWYITQDDLQFFREKVELESEERSQQWSHMMDLSYEDTSYSAWRRAISGGKTEYKSITITPNATAEEFMDFYLDDPTRPKWDSMISEYNIVEHGPAEDRCLVVRWKRTFPFSFITSREYVIARRLFRVGDALYAMTKGVEHPAAPEDGKLVRCNTYYSMWRCRTIPGVNGSDRPACESVLLHHEDMKIPERLARFAVRHGMSSFFKGVVPQVKDFVAKRRIRLAPNDEDPQAYGRAVSQPLRRCSSEPADFGSEASFASDSAFEGDASRARLQRSPSLKRLGYMMLASGVALALTRTGSTPNLERCSSRGSPSAAAAVVSGSKHSRGSSGRKRRQHDRHQQNNQSQHGGPSSSERRRRPREVATLAAISE